MQEVRKSCTFWDNIKRLKKFNYINRPLFHNFFDENILTHDNFIILYILMLIIWTCKRKTEYWKCQVLSYGNSHYWHYWHLNSWPGNAVNYMWKEQMWEYWPRLDFTLCIKSKEGGGNTFLYQHRGIVLKMNPLP